MKYLTSLLFVMAMLGASYLQAAEPEGMAAISGPIEIKGGSSPLMTVIFNHKSHRKVGSSIACLQCHHETSSDTPYSSCTAECHATPGARERDPMSMFMAFHSPDQERSCYGCHTSLAKQDPHKYAQFRGCQPCHTGPMSQQPPAFE